MSSHSQDQMQKLNSPFGELQMRVDTDQWGRRPGADRTQAGIEAQAGFDRDNQQYVQSQLDRHGWPKDPQAAHYAWLIAQHADNDPAWQQKFLDTARAAKWDNKADLAYLDDRIRTNAGRPQMYGTQFKTVYDDKARSWALESFPIEDETNLDNRRKENNLEPMQQYRNFANERMKELNLPAPTKTTMQPNPQEQRLINRYSAAQSNKEGVQQRMTAMPARASAPSPTDKVQLNKPDLNSTELQWKEKQPAQLAAVPKVATVTTSFGVPSFNDKRTEPQYTSVERSGDIVAAGYKNRQEYDAALASAKRYRLFNPALSKRFNSMENLDHLNSLTTVNYNVRKTDTSIPVAVPVTGATRRVGIDAIDEPAFGYAYKVDGSYNMNPSAIALTRRSDLKLDPSRKYLTLEALKAHEAVHTTQPAGAELVRVRQKPSIRGGFGAPRESYYGNEAEFGAYVSDLRRLASHKGIRLGTQEAFGKYIDAETRVGSEKISLLDRLSGKSPQHPNTRNNFLDWMTVLRRDNPKLYNFYKSRAMLYGPGLVQNTPLRPPAAVQNQGVQQAKLASTVCELPLCAMKQANTLARMAGNLAKDLTYFKPGAGVMRNARNLAWSSFSPGWGNVANRAATGLGAKPNTARNIGRAVTAGTFIPTSAYALSGLKGMYDDYKRTDDKARAAAGAMLASAETGAGAAENYTGVQASLLPNRQKGQSGLVSDPMRDTLQTTRDHGMLAGLYRHYVAGVPSLADPSEGPAAYQRVSNRSLLTPELRQSVDAGLNSFASTALHNAGKTLHDVPTWHKVMTTFTSPIQRIVRPMLPSDEVRNPGSLAVQSATGLPQLPTDILSAMERTTSSDQNRLLRGLGESYKLMRKYAPRPAQKQPEPQVYPQ